MHKSPEQHTSKLRTCCGHARSDLTSHGCGIFPTELRNATGSGSITTFARFSQGKAHDMILGLANRRRIWNVCSQLVDLYLENIRISSTGEFAGDDAEDIIQHNFF
jgi:hypothetical protein